MSAATSNADLAVLLTPDIYYQLVHTLRTSLPPPVSDCAEAVARRDRAAIAQVAAMLPANADEANLAAQYVAAQAYAMDCLRLAGEAIATDAVTARKCRAQATSMMREARQARSLLLRVQAVRQAREADPAATDRAAWSEHCTLGLLAEALAAASQQTPRAPEPVPSAALQPDPDARAPERLVATAAPTSEPAPPEPEPVAPQAPLPEPTAKPRETPLLLPSPGAPIRSPRTVPAGPGLAPPAAGAVNGSRHDLWGHDRPLA